MNPILLIEITIVLTYLQIIFFLTSTKTGKPECKELKAIKAEGKNHKFSSLVLFAAFLLGCLFHFLIAILISASSKENYVMNYT